jgi:hypothetical protein
MNAAECLDLLVRPDRTAPVKLAAAQLDGVPSQVGNDLRDEHRGADKQRDDADDQPGSASSGVGHRPIVLPSATGVVQRADL